MSQSSNLLVIYADKAGQLDAERLASLVGQPEPQIISEGLLLAKDALELRPTPPQYIAIDIGNRSHDVLEELDALAHACPLNVRVVVTGSVNDVSFYRALIQRGIQEYYAYPSDLAQMADTLMGQAGLPPIGLAKNAMASANKNGYAVGFVSAASGDGASTVALNVAYTLANKFNASVVLVDLDYQFGMVARHLDLKAPYGIRELLEHPDRGVDAAILNKMLVPYGRNLKIVAAPSDLRKLPDVRTEQIVALLDVLKSQFDYVLFDVQHIWLDWIAVLLSKTDHNVLVSQLWLRSLTHVTRMMAAWRESNISMQNVSLVVNRSGAKLKEAMKASDFERVSGVDIAYHLSNDTKTVVDSENQGKTLIEVGGSELVNQIYAIAQRIHANHTGEQIKIAGEAVDKKGILGFLNKKI